MKIVCDACQAKYSISDDKVQGKVFKIRCKKCSNIIVVRGGAGAAEATPPPQEKDTRVYDYGYEGGEQTTAGDDAVWHLVINQDQVGPMTVAEVQQRFAAGEVDSETFTWREGFADWLPLAQVDVFADLAASGQTTTGGGGAQAVAAMFGGVGGDEGGTMRNDPGDLFAAAASHGAPRGHDDDDGGDLFGSKPSAASAQAQAAANQKLRGERNENSVLFSLNNLAQLASDKPSATVPASAGVTSMPSGHATGQAGGEGSGLIDIRSMASAYLGGSGATVGKPATSSIGSIDDLPVFGGGGFSEPAVIVPTARPSANNKVLYLMIGAVGLLAIVAVVMVVMLLKSNKQQPQQVASSVGDKVDDKSAKGTTPDPIKTDTGSAAQVAGSATAPVDPAGSAAPPDNKTDTKTDTKAADPKTDTKAPPDKGHTTTTTATHNPKTTAPPTSHNPTTTAVVTKDPKTPKTDTTPPPKADKPDTGGCDEVSCVLNNYEGACCSKFKKGGGGAKAPPGGGGGDAAAKKPASDLPAALDRDMISAAIAGVKSRVASCGDKSPAKGVVKVHVKVGGDGKVANVSVSQTPDPALGACVAAAVQKASFGKTQNGGSFSFPFPF